MAKPLDGVALPAYFRRLGYERSTRDLLIHIRNSPPSTTLLVSSGTEGLDLLGLEEPEDEILEQPEQDLSMHGR